MDTREKKNLNELQKVFGGFVRGSDANIALDLKTLSINRVRRRNLQAVLDLVGDRVVGARPHEDDNECIGHRRVSR